jgi:hypothetical protein
MNAPPPRGPVGNGFSHELEVGPVAEPNES